MVRIISLIMAAVAFSAASAFSQPIEWEEVASGVEAPQVLMLNEDKHGGIYAVTSGGIYYSRDYAASWEWVCDSSAFNAAYVIDTNTIVAIKLDRSYRSTDRGKTWSPSYKFPSDNISIYTFQTGWDSDSKIYFLGTTGAPLYYTKNGGKSWDIIHYGPKLTADTSIKLRFASSFAVSNYALHLQTIYDNPNKRGSLGLATSTDNGETWRLNPYFSDEGDLKADNIGNVWSFMNPEYQY